MNRQLNDTLIKIENIYSIGNEFTLNQASNLYQKIKLKKKICCQLNPIEFISRYFISNENNSGSVH